MPTAVEQENDLFIDVIDEAVLLVDAPRPYISFPAS
jgi:hypothetical protein